VASAPTNLNHLAAALRERSALAPGMDAVLDRAAAGKKI
jgi:hypothetical protein